MASPATATYLVEIADPPIPNRTTAIHEMPLTEKLKIVAVLIGVGLAGCAFGWWLLQNGSSLRGSIVGLVSIFCIVAGFGPKNLTAACPYCGAKIDTIDRKNHGEGTQVHCEKCYEYSIVNTRMLRPLDPSTTSETPKFESPIYQNGVWPKGCVACGAPPVRFDDLSKFSLNAPAAVLGGINVARSSVTGIPYCEQHRDRISLKITNDKKLIMCWTSMRMMRRYLAANKSRQSF